MQLVSLRAQNFQCFGPVPFEVSFNRLTYILGPNGAGKTAALQALARMFGSDSSSRHIRSTDFHVPHGGVAAKELWLEAEFTFPEAGDPGKTHFTVAANFPHMRLMSVTGDMTVRYRLTAEIDESDDIYERFEYVIEADESGVPARTAAVSRVDRRRLEVHYLPASRDPSTHTTYATGSLIGKLLRAAKWGVERDSVEKFNEQTSRALGSNSAISDLAKSLKRNWSNLHKGAYFGDPAISFGEGDIEVILKRLNVSFNPSHGDAPANASRLSDGQQSMLYVALVLSIHELGKKLLSGELDSFDVERLQPPVFTLIAIEEPENSLSPHNLGRLLKSVSSFAVGEDAQAVIATHSASVMRRVDPLQVRYFRLNETRCTRVTQIKLPSAREDAFKYVREAVQAFPELYFARLVVLGEGDSEEIVLAKYLEARDLQEDETAVSVVPLGGRHVNHFWRLLHDLRIPFVTLLDLDLGRHGGGWGRLKYATKQLEAFPVEGVNVQEKSENLPSWDSADNLLESSRGLACISDLEKANVFFSTPLDLDLAMLAAFPEKYDVSDEIENVKNESDSLEDRILLSVLGKAHGNIIQYSEAQQKLFTKYHVLFKLSSKPVAHIDALSRVENTELCDRVPPVIRRMTDQIRDLLRVIPE